LLSKVAFVLSNVLIFYHFNRYVIASHCCFNLQFPNDIWCFAFFLMLICHLCILCNGESLPVFSPFCCSYYLLSFKSSLYSLDNILLSDIYNFQRFSPFLWLFILLIVSLTEQNCFNLNEIQLSDSLFHNSCIFMNIVCKKVTTKSKVI
jgi:hypothetical protein